MPRFPDDPNPGQIVKVEPHEEQQYIKRITVKIKADDWHEAEAQAINRQPTSTRKYILHGVLSKFPIYKGSPIHVRILDFPVLSFIFVEDCGWSAHELGEPIVQFDRKGTFITEPVLTFTTEDFNIHNEICVDLPPQDKTEEKEKENEP